MPNARVEYGAIGAGVIFSLGLQNRHSADLDILVPEGEVSQAKRHLIQHHSFAEVSIRTCCFRAQ